VPSAPSRVIGVLGASGLIGKAIFDRFERQHQAFSIGRAPTSHRHCDLEAEVSTHMFSGLDILVHAAGIRDEDLKNDGSNKARRAVDQAVAVFKTARQAGCERFVYISTAHVYGNLEGEVTEDSALNPQNAYAEAHAEIETLLADQVRAEGGRCLILRPNAVYGMTFDPARFSRWHLVPFALPLAAVKAGVIEVRSPDASRNFVSSLDIAAYAEDWLQDDSCPDVQFVNPLGQQQLSIGAYAAKCAQAVKAVTGAEIALSLGDMDAVPFSYASKVKKPVTLASIDAFLTDYVGFCASLK
jgi:UDP-glucose 4-epimerase